MELKIGDKVRFLNDVGEATIVKIVSDAVVIVEDENGFENQHHVSELVLDRAKEDYRLEGIEHVESVHDKIKAEQKEKQLDNFYKKFNHLEKMGNQEEMEIDLHIEELIDSYKGMSNTQILGIQMANFKRELNVAIQRKVKKFIVIHGVGEGVLKSEIRKELHYNYPELEFHDASYRKYGYGATEIVIRG